MFLVVLFCLKVVIAKITTLKLRFGMLTNSPQP